MIGHTSKQRLKRKALLKRKPKLKSKSIRMTGWMEPTPENLDWLKQEVAISKQFGHSDRHVIKTENGCLFALARKG